MKRRRFLQTLPALSAGLTTLPVARTLHAEQRPHALGASMWSYLWDIADEGYEPALRIMKENGLTAVSLAAAYHAGKFLAPHNPKRKVVFLEDGTVYFLPVPSLYGTIKPIVNALVREGHTLDEVRRRAERLGMQTNAWVVCCHNTPLGTAHPEITCENAFGDRILHNLCPSHPAVRAYLRSLVGDIAARGVQRIELEAMQFQGYAHGYHHEREGVPLTGALRFLLGLCFCPSCLQRAAAANIDIASVRNFSRQSLQLHFDDPTAVFGRFTTIDDLPHDIIQPFLQWRMGVVASLAEELQSAVQGTGVHLRPLASIDPVARLMVGMDARSVAGLTGGLLVPTYVKDGAAVRKLLPDLLAMTPGAEVIAGMQVGMPESGGKPEFISRMKATRELGIREFNFYNYGLVPQQNLSWIKESLI